jgi:poly-gamma-glutamate synthesis protein (capsule biosynthesis protein)
MRGWRALAAVVLVAGAAVPLAALRQPARAATSIGPAVLSFGDAAPEGDPTTLRPSRPIVGMAATPDGGGYWLVASDGGVFSYGSARFLGSTGGTALNRPIVGMAATPDGGGYWLVASDGGVFSYGSARFLGSTGGTALNRPIVGMAASPDGGGYWLLGQDGGVFSYGAAAFKGSGAGQLGVGRVALGMASSPTGNGYRILAAPQSLRVGFAGDVHGVGRVGNLLAAGGNPLTPMSPVLAADDVNVVNLETAVGYDGTAQAKQYVFHSPPSLLTALHNSSVQVVSLANNHSLDFGPAGLLETLDDAHAAGLSTVGAGRNKAEAYAPAILQTPGGTVAVIGLSQVVPAGWAATDSAPGVASAYDTAASVNAVRAARTMADHVVVMVHAGVENADCPNAMQRDLADLLFNAGAEVVAGAHPHRLEPIAAGPGGNKLVIYSLGNFVWYDNTPPNDLTGVLSVQLGPAGVEGYDFHPARIDATGSPIPISGPVAWRC